MHRCEWVRAWRWVAAELPSRLNLKGSRILLVRSAEGTMGGRTCIELGVGGGMDYDYQEQLYYDVRNAWSSYMAYRDIVLRGTSEKLFCMLYL